LIERTQNFKEEFEKIFCFDEETGFGFKTCVKEQISKLVFCYQNGKLIDALGMKGGVKGDEDLWKELVKFYSMKMLVLHCQQLKDNQGEKERIKRYFQETHEYESFREFIHRDKQTDQIKRKRRLVKKMKNIEKKLREMGESDLDIREEDNQEVLTQKEKWRQWDLEIKRSCVVRSVVMTFSRTRKDTLTHLKEICLTLSEIDEDGTAKLEEKVRNFLEEVEGSRLMVVEVTEGSRADLVKYIKSIVDNCLQDFFSKHSDPRASELGKEIVLIFFKPLEFGVVAGKRIPDLEYFEDEWEFQVIDDLEDCCYRENLKYMDEFCEDVNEKFRNGKCMELLSSIFIQSIKDMQLPPHIDQYLKDLLLPTLQKQLEICKQRVKSEISVGVEIEKLGNLDGAEVESTEMKAVHLLGKGIMEGLMEGDMKEWKEFMFRDPFAFEHIHSIKQCIIRIWGNEFRKKLEFDLKYLTEYHGLSNLMTLQNYPRDCQHILETVFKERFEKFKKKKM
jgi:hypothetical protein